MRKQFTTSLDSEIITALKIQAIKENCDPCQIIEKLLREYLAKQVE